MRNETRHYHEVAKGIVAFHGEAVQRDLLTDSRSLGEEPAASLTRPSATLSPNGGEGIGWFTPTSRGGTG
ncbi:hypothetical protein GMSM_29820 [Geomonas sp. Red276]